MTYTEQPTFTTGLVMPEDLQKLADGITQQQQVFQTAFVAGGGDSPATSTLTNWFAIGTITVPDWATSAVMSLKVTGLYSVTSVASLSINGAITIGTAATASVHIGDPGVLGQRFEWTPELPITGFASGVQTVRASAARLAGTGSFRADAATYSSCTVRFL